VGLERGPLGLVSRIEELLERESSGSGPENREYCRRDPSRWPRGTLYPQKLVLSSPTSGGRSVGIVRSRTHAMEFSLVFTFPLIWLPHRQVHLPHNERIICFLLCAEWQISPLGWGKGNVFGALSLNICVLAGDSTNLSIFGQRARIASQTQRETFTTHVTHFHMWKPPATRLDPSRR
jgi:hypothetical protein